MARADRLLKVAVVLNAEVAQKLQKLQKIYHLGQTRCIVDILTTVFYNNKHYKEFLNFFMSHDYVGSKGESVFIWIPKALDKHLVDFCSTHINQPVHRSKFVRAAIMYVAYRCGLI